MAAAGAISGDVMPGPGWLDQMGPNQTSVSLHVASLPVIWGFQ